MQKMKQFESNSKFYSTLLHEITHATEYIKPLDRESITSGKAKFSNQLYAMEKLVAEIGCAFLFTHIGFDAVPQHAAYIDSWLNVLKADKKAIFKATEDLLALIVIICLMYSILRNYMKIRSVLLNVLLK